MKQTALERAVLFLLRQSFYANEGPVAEEALELMSAVEEEIKTRASGATV